LIAFTADAYFFAAVLFPALLFDALFVGIRVLLR
jgi:hypothetical protein